MNQTCLSCLQTREEYTRKSFMLEAISTDFYRTSGDTVLEDMWTAIHMGDYISYYLAIAYQVDPTPVPMLISLKEHLKNPSKE